MFYDTPTNGADSARRHLDAQIAAAEAKLQRAKELETKVQNLKGRASSRRGEVSVTVDSSGGLSDLKLTDASRGWILLSCCRLRRRRRL